MFLIFSLLLSWRLGKQKSIRCGRRSRSRWITRPGSGHAACLGSLEPGGGGGGRGTAGVSSETKGRSQVQVRSTGGGEKKKQGIYCLGRKMRNKFPHGTGGASSLLSSFFYFFASFLRIVVASVPLSLHTSLPTPFGWYTGPEPVIMPTLQIWAQNISTPGSVIIR